MRVTVQTAQSTLSLTHAVRFLSSLVVIREGLAVATGYSDAPWVEALSATDRFLVGRGRVPRAFRGRWSEQAQRRVAQAIVDRPFEAGTASDIELVRVESGSLVSVIKDVIQGLRDRLSHTLASASHPQFMLDVTSAIRDTSDSANTSLGTSVIVAGGNLMRVSLSDMGASQITVLDDPEERDYSYRKVPPLIFR